MTTSVQAMLEEARQLTPVEQLELIRALSELVQAQYQQEASQPQQVHLDRIPASIKRTKPVTNLDEYTADFWPDDESIEELNAYIQRERTADRFSDQ